MIGRHNNTLNGIGSLKGISTISDENKPFANYILAKANYLENNKEEAEKNIAEIQKQGVEQWIYAAKKLKEKYTK